MKKCNVCGNWVLVKNQFSCIICYEQLTAEEKQKVKHLVAQDKERTENTLLIYIGICGITLIGIILFSVIVNAFSLKMDGDLFLEILMGGFFLFLFILGAPMVLQHSIMVRKIRKMFKSHRIKCPDSKTYNLKRRRS